jgi:cytochrome c-type biogenesis protein
VGPILAGILTIAASRGGALEGATLLFAYAMGIGIPFLLAAAFATPFLGFVQRFRRHFRKVEIALGLLLIATGLLVMTGGFQEIGAWMIERWPELGRFG